MSAKKFEKRQYNNIAFDGVWAESFGVPEWRSRWLVYGNSGEGKTEFCCQLASYMSQFGKVIFASAEQGDCHTLQSAWRRNNLFDKSNIYLAINIEFKSLCNEVAKRGKSKLIIIDSIDYLGITKNEYIEIHKRAKQHMLVFVSWRDGKKPKTQTARDIEYMCEGKILVDNYVAFGRMRSGGNIPYIIWNEKAKEKHGFLNRK